MLSVPPRDNAGKVQEMDTFTHSLVEELILAL